MTMVIRFALFFAALALGSASGVSLGAPPLGMQGFTWGEIRYPSSEEPREKQDLVLEGAIDQGIDLFSLGENTRLNAFGRLDYKLDSESLDYNNKLKLGAGVKLRHYLSDSVVVDLGARYEWERRMETNRTLDGVSFNLSWFGSWLLQCDGCQEGHFLAGRQFPGLIWGDVRYPGAHDPVEDNDLVAEGAIEQGIDWTRVGGFGTLNTFAVVDYVADTEGLEYYRSVGVGVGVKLKIPVGKVGLVQVGARYIRDYRWESDVTHDVLMAFVNWSAWWDPRAVRYDIPEDSLE